ncbi:hypothetical protein EKO04_006468 [Ascochyta lentis]|uniref:Uncharacterized protein n=1 Tax=Ascochyta lentis TaxID=205686 RepID=A0A8H7J530_9PLEO|nr:hypothetical protein EKO04_006468 [Ascochyta lentis]
MRQRLEQLPKYGNQPAEWAKLLVPIFDRFIATFEQPDDEDHLKTFWLTVCHAERGGSGQPDTFSGWMTAFAFWQSNGSRNWFLNPDMRRPPRIGSLKPQLSLDGQLYAIIEQNHIPCGVAQVPVVILDMERSLRFDTNLIAGSVGMSIIKENGYGTMVQPRSGWWMLCDQKETFL